MKRLQDATACCCAAGECYDEMNRAVWVVALNAIMQTKATADGGFSFAPGAFDQLSPPIHESDVRLPASRCFASPCSWLLSHWRTVQQGRVGMRALMAPRQKQTV